MTADEAHTVGVLNGLHAAERGSLLLRLGEMENFSSPAEAAELERLQRMIAEAVEHQAWLAEGIERLGGSLDLGRADVATAHLHYLTLSAVLPRVVASVESVAGRYVEASRGALRLTPEAASLVARIGERQRRHVEQLGQMQGRMAVLPAEKSAAQSRA